jgi:signal transduction histidine kinase
MSDTDAQSAEFEARLEQAKLAALVELAYGAGHEINNPLANIAARAQTLLTDERDPERRRKLQAIHRQAMRAHEMIADLMLFARPPKLEVSGCHLRQIVLQVADEHREWASERTIDVVCELGDTTILIVADATQLAVAIAAVVTNSIEAVGKSGQVAVAARDFVVADIRTAEVVVRDDGPGISPAVREHLFDPFFSGREAGRGLGFGLSKCWRIITNHCGQIVVNNLPSGGAEFTILLPQPV